MTWIMAQTDAQVDFRREVQEKSGHDVALCYQCGKCTAGCPIAFAMDYPPNQIMRGIQLGMRDAVLSSQTIWLCAACETCSTRCPQEVEPAAIMDALRQIAYAEGIRSPESDVPLFHRIFLGSVRGFGRVFEMGMIGAYNMLSGHFLKDVLMAPKLLFKGKLAVLPELNGHRGELRDIFQRAREVEAELR